MPVPPYPKDNAQDVLKTSGFIEIKTLFMAFLI